MEKKLFKVIFYDENRVPVTIYGETVTQAEILGFVEVGELVFKDPSEIIATPDDDKAKNIFKDAERTLIPINSVIRIDEMRKEKKAPVINIYKAEK